MDIIKKLLLAITIGGVLLAGCGGSGGGGNDSGGGGGGDGGGDGGGGNTGTVISGTASAPGGSVAQLSAHNIFEIAASFIITPTFAEVIGLLPVTGATVELIRVDNNGDQLGAVLATTTTSITGNYTITLPQGVNLAGDLVVRITGNGGVNLRAQVVEVAVDITPVSEFVLKKYIDNGANLNSLVADDVVKLKGRINGFDLTAGADLSSMLASLESEIGDFVDNSVAASIATTGDVSTITGNYRHSGFRLALRDGDAYLHGSFAVNVDQNELTISSGGNGIVNFTSSSDNGASLSLTGTESAASIYSESDTDEEGDSFTASLSSDENGILTVTNNFSESIDIVEGNDCCGWRWIPSTVRLQKVANRDLFFLTSEDAAARYLLTDTNHDGTADAIDPAKRVGDEVERSLDVIARKPSAMTPADLNGNFGRIWFGTYLASVSRTIEVETESNILTFNGDGTFDYGAVAAHQILSRGSYTVESEGATTGATVVTTADGDITSAGGENQDAFINNTYDFMVFANHDANVDNGAGSGSSDRTMMIKLGAGTPVVSGNTYRVIWLSMQLINNAMVMINSRFDSRLTMSSESAGSLSMKSSVVYKENLGANLNVVNNNAEIHAVTAAIGSKGVTTLTTNDSDNGGTWEGFFNADATLGIFRSTITPTDADPNGLGMVVLIKIN